MAVILLLLLGMIPTVSAQTSVAKTYPLHAWKNMTCRAKGRFQDREYCASEIMDRIVADGKSSIPVLISQITDSRWIAEPVYDFWPRIRVGELAYFILYNLFVDDTWTKNTMPELFSQPKTKCDDLAGYVGAISGRRTAWLRFKRRG